MNIQTNDIVKCNYALHDLYNVYDPEIGLNIVDLGLVYELHFDEVDHKLLCMMTLTTQFCPMGDAITRDTYNSLVKSYPGWEVTVSLTFDPAWDLSMLSDDGKAFLGR